MSKRADEQRAGGPQPEEASPAERERRLEPAERKGRVAGDDTDFGARAEAEAGEAGGEESFPEPEEREEGTEEEGEGHEPLDRGHVCEDKGLDR